MEACHFSPLSLYANNSIHLYPSGPVPFPFHVWNALSISLYQPSVFYVLGDQLESHCISLFSLTCSINLILLNYPNSLYLYLKIVRLEGILRILSINFFILQMVKLNHKKAGTCAGYLHQPSPPLELALSLRHTFSFVLLCN